jgi:hypothetical protein
MAIGWLTLLKHVPWTEVVSNAPKVADGARKLWKAVAKKSPAASGEATATLAAGSAPDARTARLEGVVADLQGQMVASSELIKALADQNARLVASVGTLRTRIAWLAALLAAVAAGLVFALLR